MNPKMTTNLVTFPNIWPHGDHVICLNFWRDISNTYSQNILYFLFKWSKPRSDPRSGSFYGSGSATLEGTGYYPVPYCTVYACPGTTLQLWVVKEINGEVQNYIIFISHYDNFTCEDYICIVFLQEL